MKKSISVWSFPFGLAARAQAQARRGGRFCRLRDRPHGGRPGQPEEPGAGAGGGAAPGREGRTAAERPGDRTLLGRQRRERRPGGPAEGGRESCGARSNARRDSASTRSWWCRAPSESTSSRGRRSCPTIWRTGGRKPSCGRLCRSPSGQGDDRDRECLEQVPAEPAWRCGPSSTVSGARGWRATLMRAMCC